MNYGSAQSVDQEEDTQFGKYLTFTVGDEEYGIGIRFVTEIIGLQSINSLPETPCFVKGIINLRGIIIPVVDMRLRFGKKEMPFSDRTCIVVVETARITAGLIVDQVCEVTLIDEDNIVPPPDIQLKGSRRYISGIGKVGAEVKLLVDCERLFDDDETTGLNKIHEVK